MVDRLSKPARSKNMSKIRSSDTKPELAVRRFLHSRGLRFRLHRRDLPGKPDIVLPRYRTVVQVHGCFWHQHEDPDCVDSHVPASNRSYWGPKLERTVVRDRESYGALQSLGWNVEVVWECRINRASLEELADRIRSRG